MALKNVIYPGTYTTVAVDYNKKKRFIGISAAVYEDETCKNNVTTISTQFQSLRDVKEVDAFTLPTNPKKDDEFFSPVKITVDDAEQFGVFKYNGTQWNCTRVDAVYCNGKYYKYTDTGYVEDTKPDNSKYWDDQFAIDKIKSKSDILAFAYSWLKANHPAFKNAEDC